MSESFPWRSSGFRPATHPAGTESSATRSATSALSVCSVLLYLWLIREGAVSRSASLIYLVPAVAAVEAWLLFGETLSALQVGGILVTIAGVGLATR